MCKTAPRRCWAGPSAAVALWLFAKRAEGVPSPNDVRSEEGWPASTDPTADSIAPPNTRAQAAAGDTPPGDAGAGKIVDINEHRHAGD
jgi:hypothetical protein